MSLLDKIRSGDSWTTAWVFGFDPDVDTAGYCMYRFKYNSVGLVQGIEVRMGTIYPTDKKAKNMKKVSSMCDSIAQHDFKIKASLDVDNDDGYALIEGQQVYFKDNESKKDVVAKANKLLMLATIGGSMIGRLYKDLEHNLRLSLVRPFDWKGTAQKGAMHEEFISVIKKSEIDVYIDNVLYDLGDWEERVNIHTLDACCMAHKSAEKIAKGVWK